MDATELLVEFTCSRGIRRLNFVSTISDFAANVSAGAASLANDNGAVYENALNVDAE